ncbi:hypothetical protein BHE74_00010999 [Ensete ventricosum]|nr:hypothetical protein BHE74_00010999 [Ensete ventricosum]
MARWDPTQWWRAVRLRVRYDTSASRLFVVAALEFRYLALDQSSCAACQFARGLVKRGLALDRCLDSTRQLGPTPPVAPTRVTAGGGGQSQSSSASGIFFQGDGGQNPAPVSSMSGNDCSGFGPASGDMNQILNSRGNSSGPSVGASSLVTDANSTLSGGAQLQRSTSFNNESYMRIPASPMSFSSNISGSSVMDGCSIDNSILYWRKFVAEYFAVRAKKRWCLSLYDNMGNHALGVFPQLAVDAWQCDICGSKSGKGFG